MSQTIWRLTAWDAFCTTHGTHDFEARVYTTDDADSDVVRAEIKERMHKAFLCDITDFGCYVATPIYQYALAGPKG